MHHADFRVPVERLRPLGAYHPNHPAYLAAYADAVIALFETTTPAEA